MWSSCCLSLSLVTGSCCIAQATLKLTSVNLLIIEIRGMFVLCHAQLQLLFS